MKTKHSACLTGAMCSCSESSVVVLLCCVVSCVGVEGLRAQNCSAVLTLTDLGVCEVAVAAQNLLAHAHVPVVN